MHQTGISRFGTTSFGAQVERIILAQDDITVSILSYGAAVQGLWIRGVPYSLTLGSDKIADYEGPMAYFGTLIGPVANRLTRAAAPISGKRRSFAPNDGENLLHSGPSGTQARLWRLAELTETTAMLSLDLDDGEGGFPGVRHLTARYSLIGPATLRLDIWASSDAPTLFNFANHSYWNLDGTPSWSGHSLRVAAQGYLPTDDQGLPSGRVIPATGDMDFRTTRAIRPGSPPLDHNFCLATTRRSLTAVAQLIGHSGLAMVLATTEPGLQVYDGRTAQRPGQAVCEGIALEAQGWPDAPNKAGFPSIETVPGDPYHQQTEWRFNLPPA